MQDVDLETRCRMVVVGSESFASRTVREITCDRCILPLSFGFDERTTTGYPSRDRSGHWYGAANVARRTLESPGHGDRGSN